MWVSIEHLWDLSTKSHFHKVKTQWYNYIQFVSKFSATYIVDKKKKEKGLRMWALMMWKSLLVSKTREQNQNKTKNSRSSRHRGYNFTWILTINIYWLLTLHTLNWVSQKDGDFIYNTCNQFLKKTVMVKLIILTILTTYSIYCGWI